jgi:hypothetical protein
VGDWIELHRLLAAEVRVHAGFTPLGQTLPHAGWMWFLRPVAFADFTFGPDGPIPLIAITNPLVWLLTLPAMAFLARRAWRDRRAEDALLVALFAATYAPFLLTSRPIWVHSALAVLPFALVAVAVLVVRLADLSGRRNVVVATYVAILVVSSAPLIAIAVGRGMELPGLRQVVESYRPDPTLEANPEGR